MRLIEERRGSCVISYVYEPDSYVPLARLDANGERTEQGGLGTQDDAVFASETTTQSIAASAIPTSAESPNHSKPAANDAESRYWASLRETAQQKAEQLQVPHWGTGTDGPARQAASTQAKLCEVYYFHTDQVGLPEELSNAQGQLVWQASYKTWGGIDEHLTGNQGHRGNYQNNGKGRSIDRAAMTRKLGGGC